MTERFQIISPATQGTRGQGIDPEFFLREPYTQFQTWLGETESAVGCPVGCTYCFFKLDGQTPKRPDIMLSPEATVTALGDVPTYHPDIPVHFGSQTDAFSTKATISHYTDVLRHYGSSDYPNPLVFITKRRIPQEFMDLAGQIPQKVLFYISYSGLNGTGLELSVNERHQQDNFAALHERGLQAVHYWRPFLPPNSSERRISSIMDFVAQYATCSVINGLRLNDGIRENIAPYWPEIMEETYDFHTAGEFWPEGVRGFIAEYAAAAHPDYPIYFGNTPCSIAYATKQPDVQGLLGGRMCSESSCPTTQRDRCNASKQPPTIEAARESAGRIGIEAARITVEDGRVLLDGAVNTGELVYLRYALRAPVVSRAVAYAGGHNWANVTDDVPITEVPWTRPVTGQ